MKTFAARAKICTLNHSSCRSFSVSIVRLMSSGHKSLQEILAEKIPKEKKRVAAFRKKSGKFEVGTTTINMLYGGMRGMKALVTETSFNDANDGVRFRGLTVDQVREHLPRAEGGCEPLPEGIFWLMVTGECPTKDQVQSLSCEWAERAKLPKFVVCMLKAMPKSLHPMSQLSAAVTALNHDSKFLQAYKCNVKKDKYWEACFEDAMDLIAKLPVLAAIIYSNVYGDGKLKGTIDSSLDWSANFMKLLGFDDPKFIELMRLYLTLHSDHSGGNVSAHATHLVGSALSDPYLSFSAGLNGLAGPLHGLANQNTLLWLQKLQKDAGEDADDDKIKEFIESTLKSGQVVPGYGHAVMRGTDPRFNAFSDFGKQHLPDDETFKLVTKMSELVPPILNETGKVKNPCPNVDAVSGSLLHHFCLRETEFYTVLFGMSRALGVMASLIWDRALGLPIERPQSVTTDGLMELVKKQEEECEK